MSKKESFKLKRFVSHEVLIKNLFNSQDIIFMLKVSLLKSKSHMDRKENAIESGVIYSCIFDPSKEPTGLNYFSNKIIKSELNDCIEKAQLFFDNYIRKKELIYDIEII